MRFAKETTCLLFSMFDFRQFIITFILLCKTDETGTDFLSTFFTFYLNFRNFKDWITLRSDILDGLYRGLCDFTVSRLNGAKQIILQ